MKQASRAAKNDGQRLTRSTNEKGQQSQALKLEVSMQKDQHEPKLIKKVKTNEVEEISQPQRLLRHLQVIMNKSHRVEMKRLNDQNVVPKDELDVTIQSLIDSCQISKSDKKIKVYTTEEAEQQKKFQTEDVLSEIDETDIVADITNRNSLRQFLRSEGRSAQIKMVLKEKDYSDILTRRPALKHLDIEFNINDDAQHQKSFQKLIKVLSAGNYTAKLLYYKIDFRARRRIVDEHLEDIFIAASRFTRLRVLHLSLEIYSQYDRLTQIVLNYLSNVPLTYPCLKDFQFKTPSNHPFFLYIIHSFEEVEQKRLNKKCLDELIIHFGSKGILERKIKEDFPQNQDWHSQFEYVLDISFESKYTHLKFHQKHYQKYLHYLSIRAPYITKLTYRQIFRQPNPLYTSESFDILRIALMCKLATKIELKLHCAYKKMVSLFPILKGLSNLNSFIMKMKYTPPSHRFLAIIEELYLEMLQKNLTNMEILQYQPNLHYRVLVKPEGLNEITYTGKQLFEFHSGHSCLIIKQTNQTTKSIQIMNNLITNVSFRMKTLDICRITSTLEDCQESYCTMLYNSLHLFDKISRMKLKIRAPQISKAGAQSVEMLFKLAEQKSETMSFKWGLQIPVPSEIMTNWITTISNLKQIVQITFDAGLISWISLPISQIYENLTLALVSQVDIDLCLQTHYNDLPDDLAEQNEGQYIIMSIDKINFLQQVHDKSEEYKLKVYRLYVVAPERNQFLANQGEKFRINPEFTQTVVQSFCL